MAVTFRKEASIDVVEAGRMRIKNLFSNGIPIQMSFSGGKDSLCLAHLTYDLILKGEIRADLLTVIFIDEEAIFPCVEKVVLEWRKKFLMVGAKFIWFAMEYKHFNCFNMLSTEETFICFDRYKEDVWVRHFYFGIGGHNKFMRIADDYELLVRSFLYTRFTHIPVCCYAQRFDGNNSQYKNEYEESDYVYKECDGILYHITDYKTY